MCDSTAEIKACISGTEIYGTLQVVQSLLVVAETAFSDASVMIAGCEYRIKGDRSVEVTFCSAKVTEIVLGDSTEEECPVVSRIKLRKDIEVLYGLGIFSLCEGMTTPHHEHVLVILCMKLLQPG